MYDPRDLLLQGLSYMERLGVHFGDLRYQEYSYETVVAEDGSIREYSTVSRRGIGVRIFYKGSIGFSSTNSLTKEDLFKSIDRAYAIARSIESSKKFSQRKVYKDRVSSQYKEDPFEVPLEEKTKLVVEANKNSMIQGIRSAVSRLGLQRDRRIIVSLDGAEVEVLSILSGFSHMSIAQENDARERVYDSMSRVAGWEFIASIDWSVFTRELSDLAVKAVKAPMPKAGRFKIVSDPDLIGLILHEAFGHASEGDLVASGTSILKNRIGERIASENVSIVDDGLVEGGFFVPYDDEGNKKTSTVIVEEGILRRFLTHMISASELEMEVTGNGRAQDFENIPIVRQTNLYMKPGDHSFEELFEDIKEGYYLLGRGAGGGQVDTGAGTFTFSVGPSYEIRNGEIIGLVRSTIISGFILETLKGVEAIGRDLKIKTSVFGGCGKEGQLVRVGHGGPHVRIASVLVGGV
ncbi:MAG: TldD/PmbA family protein [Sulfolobales archaeon]